MKIKQDNQMNRKFQIFVSSTYTDLIEERQAAVSAILTAGHIPAGMELFKPGDQTQLDIIKRWIDESDIYLLILGGRYGTIAPDNDHAYTELEYDYALKNNKPLFSVVIDNNFLNDKVKDVGASILELENPDKYKSFRAKVVSYPVEFFRDTKDIQIAIYKTLPTLISDRDLKGWVSGREIPDSTFLIDQVSRLTKENEDLKNQIALASSQSLDMGELTEEKTSSSQNEEFIKTMQIFEKSALSLSKEISGTEEAVKSNVLRLMVAYRGTLLTGLSTAANTAVKSFLVRNVCTAMQIHGLMKTRPIMEGRFLAFELTDKGAAFYKFMDEIKVNK
ncbi:DUF4062 domain-containing protein [Pantoea agglomerans]|uniref:DUF4062 domain-containing protein n=1 Tax=Enterobacter agglomerans TaxID=549 RepID=UPI00320A0247